MRKLVYVIKDTDGNIIQTVTTLKEKQKAVSLGYVATDKVEEVDTFQPWKEETKLTHKKGKYHKFAK